MYVIYNKYRHAYKTYDGWTRVQGGAIVGLKDVMRFTKGEVNLNKDTLPNGSEFRYYPNYERALNPPEDE